MFENDFENCIQNSSTHWNGLILKKRESFKQQLRTKQIQQYKTSIRQKYNIVINYSNPSITASQIKNAIAKRLHTLEYVHYKSSLQIFQVVENMMSQFRFCQVLMQQKIVQFLLVAIIDQESKFIQSEMQSWKQKYLQLWVNLVYKTTQNWNEIWQYMYRQTVNVLWAILVQFPKNQSLTQKMHYLFRYWNQNFSIQPQIKDEDIVQLIESKQICPLILQIISQYINPRIEHILSQQNLIQQKSFLLDLPQYCTAYLRLLTRVSFIDKQILQKIYGILFQRQNQQIENKLLCIQILYQQMELTDEELRKLAQNEKECQEYIKEILQEDY